ncbi:MAG: FRG domain-containing protein [Bacteroidales bacterium]|nr:FRG domain-containing protein [Bacteroidales bacterium]
MIIPKYQSLDEKKGSFKDYKCINSIEDFMRWYESLSNDGSIFRGLSESKYKNYTSAQRHNIMADYEDLPFQTQIMLELDELRKTNSSLLERYCKNMRIPCTDLYLLSFAQHYGGIAPLLDFTKDYNTALFFMTDGASFPPDGIGDKCCNDISNYCSFYFIKNDDISRTSDYLFAFDDFVESSSKDEEIKIKIPKVINVQGVIDYLLSKEIGKGNLESIFSYYHLCNFCFTPAFIQEGRMIPLLIENSPISIDEDGERSSYFLTITNLNIESQHGCFLLHTHYDYPLEKELGCVDIHKSLVPYIEQKILKPKGINKQSIYPNEESIVKEAFYKSLGREDYAKYYYF